MSTFINMALTQVVKRNDVPFEVANPTPSKDMLKALAELSEMINNPDKYPRYNNWKDLKSHYYPMTKYKYEVVYFTKFKKNLKKVLK